MMNVRKLVDVKLVMERGQMQRLTSKPNFHSFSIFHNNLIAIQLTKQKVDIKQPIYVGFSVLELSKLLMYTFHYRHIVPKYGDKAKLLFTDTDSLTYEIKTRDIYEDMMNDKHLFDASDNPPDHPLYSIQKKKF